MFSPGEFGVSFQPAGPGQQGGASSPPVQQAIRFLSLRLPRVVGATAMAPGALLNGPGGAGVGQGQMSLEQLLAHLFGMGGPSAGGPMASPIAGQMAAPGTPPGPRIVPADKIAESPPSGDTPRMPTFQPSPSPTIDRPPTLPPGVGAPTYQPAPWSVRPGMGVGGPAGAVDRLTRFGY